jgi:TRAP-type C4-dicarboxylate transport system permease small subunit
MRHLLDRLEQALDGIEAYVAVGGLAAMLALSVVQVLARNLFETGFPTAEIVLRYLVLLVSFAGATLAIREHRHIKIDVALIWFPDAWRARVGRLCSLLAALVCGVFTWASARFFWEEWQYAPPHETWIAAMVLIMPVSFALMAMHFLLRCIARRSP